MSFFYGRKRDYHDSRDQVLKMLMFNRQAVGEIDAFAGLNLPVYDQGQIGSCTANAGVLYRRWLAQKFPQYSAKDQDLSRLFLYYQERALPWNKTTGEDSGASTRDVCIVTIKTGIPPSGDDPYNVAKFDQAPSSEALADAAAYKAGAYHRVADTDTVISCLVSGYPVLLGVTLYPSFENISGDGVMPMPSPEDMSQGPIGGHEMVIHGYSSSRKALRLQNSWGASWGDGGHLWMPEAYLDNFSLSESDMAIIHLGPAWK